jgi:hypothetical protein
LEADGRYVASAVITDPTNEELTVGVDGNFAKHQEAHDRAIEVAMASVDTPRVASDRHMSG